MQSRLPFIAVMATIMIDAMGIGLILPVTPDLIEQIMGEDISHAALWGGVLSFTYAAMQFLFGPTIGNLSDRFGRRPVLITSLVILGVDYLIMSVAQSVWLLVLARAMSGIAGATQSTATAYLADTSSKEKRAANFGLVGAAFGIGFVLGPFVGGVLGEIGVRGPFLAAAALALMNATLVYFTVAESLPVEKRRVLEWRRCNPLSALMRLRQIPAIGLLVLVELLFVLSTHVYPVIWSFFATLQFGWSPGMIGASLAAYGLLTALVMGWLIRKILHRLGEVRTALLGLGVNVVALVVVGINTSPVLVFVLMPIIALGAIAGPAIHGIMSNEVSDSEQGELLGVLTSIAGIAAILSPPLAAATFWVFTNENAPVFLPGAPFLVSAILAAGALILFRRWQTGQARQAATE